MIMHENDILRHANTAVQMAQTFVNVTKSLKQTGYTLYSLVVTCTKLTPRVEKCYPIILQTSDKKIRVADFSSQKLGRVGKTEISKKLITRLRYRSGMIAEFFHY
jgi:hypothetical protein